MTQEIEIKWNTLILVVGGEYIEAEAEESYHGDGSGYPGAPSEFNIEYVMCDSQDIFEELSFTQLSSIKDDVINKIEEV